MKDLVAGQFLQNVGMSLFNQSGICNSECKKVSQIHKASAFEQ